MTLKNPAFIVLVAGTLLIGAGAAKGARARRFSPVLETPGRTDGQGEFHDRILATLLFTDLVESTATLVRVGDVAWRELLAAHHQAARSEVERFRGRIVDTAGDGLVSDHASCSRFRARPPSVFGSAVVPGDIPEHWRRRVE